MRNKFRITILIKKIKDLSGDTYKEKREKALEERDKTNDATDQAMEIDDFKVSRAPDCFPSRTHGSPETGTQTQKLLVPLPHHNQEHFCITLSRPTAGKAI